MDREAASATSAASATGDADASARGGAGAGLVERLQAYMRLSAVRRYEAVPIPPFTAYFHPFDAMVYSNYAIPDGPLSGDLKKPLAELRSAFKEQGRVPRFEYVAELAPDLAGALSSAGFRFEAEARLMVCTRATFTPSPPPEGLSISILTHASSLDDFIAHGATGRRGFGSEDLALDLAMDADKTREDIADGCALLGRVGGEPAAVGLFTSPSGGLSELAGVTTLKEHRGRGFGAAIVSQAAAEAFDRGIDTLFLSTITEEAGRLYERVGFRFVTSMLFYIDAEHPAAGAG